jgi:2-methylisocitrate lyase-like PEP mutase family enzyme
MLRKKITCPLVLIAGISAAAVAVLSVSVGGYLLHKKVVKRRLRELARKQTMNLAVYDLNRSKRSYDYDDYDDYDEDGDDDYGGFDNLISDIKQGDEDI